MELTVANHRSTKAVHMSRENVLITLFFFFVLVIPALMVIGVYGKLISGLLSKSSKKPPTIIPNVAADISTTEENPDPKKTDAD